MAEQTLSLEQALGPAPSLAEKAKGFLGIAPKAPADVPGALTLEQAFGGPDAIDASALAQQSPLEFIKEMGKRAVALPAATGDLILGVPGMVAGHLMNVGTRLYAAATGESGKLAGQAGELAEQLPTLKIPGTALEIPLEGLKTPLQTIVKSTLGVEPWDQEVVDKAMKSVSTGVEKLTKGVVTAEDARLAMGVAMDVAGAKGLQVGAKVIAERAAPKAAVTPREEPPAARAETPELVEITSPKQVREIFQAAKKNRGELAAGEKLELERLFGRAKEARPAEEAAFPPGEVSKGRLVEPTILGQERPAIDTALEKLRAGQGFDMTAEERIAARAVLRQDAKGAIVDPEGKVILPKDQAGSIDPELLKHLAKVAVVSGAGAYAAIQAWKMYKSWQADKEFEERNAPPTEPYDQPTNDQRGFPTQLALGLAGGAAIGAVKLKGTGVWTEGAVRRLAEPLGDAAARGVGHDVAGLPGEIPLDTMARAQKPVVDWAERAVKNHLRRYFGAAEDPLNAVEIPMLGDEVTWGQIADQVVKSAKIPVRLKMMREGKAMKGEDVWDVEHPYGFLTPAEALTHDSMNALQSYLSHVGDYLREFVPPEKLAQYDLARAVRETAAQDAKQAAKMAKARASGEGTVPYKTYPDGMKWVEVKSADALKNEGDVMGHCVGGYCEAVHNGESKIYSLRDAKGMSHVTVEVAPSNRIWINPTEWYYAHATEAFQKQYPRPTNDLNNALARWTDTIAKSHEYQVFDAAERTKPLPEDILQIKGKQNRAPVAQYLPYVQDFVKSGKWGEVGDLENTGLYNVEYANLNHYMMQGRPEVSREARIEAINKARASGELKGYMTRPEWEAVVDKYVPKGPGNQRGSADPKQLAALAAVGGGALLGAYMDPKDPVHGAIYGAVAGAVATRIRPRAIAEAIQRASAAGPLIRIDDLARETVYARKVAAREAYKISSRIEDVVPDVARREAIYRWLDGDRSVKLSEPETQIAEGVKDFYAGFASKAMEAGVIKNVLEDYATRIYGQAGRGLLRSGPIGGDTRLDSPFGKRRTFPTLKEAEAAGFRPITTDIARVIEAYSDSITNAMENRRYIAALREAKTGEGKPLIAKEGKAPQDYVFIDHPQLRGYRVHPDIAGDLRFTFDQSNPGAILRSLDAINTTQKRMAVSFSLFHATALEHAMLGATAFVKSPGRFVRSVGQSLAPSVLGESVMLRQLREGGQGDLVDRAMKSGLEFGFERQSPALPELKSGFYEMMKGATDFLDQTVPGLGRQSVGRITELNHAFDRFMWGRLHPTLKLETWAEKASELSRNNARDVAAGKAPLKSLEEIDRMAASFSNDVYGGLNWQAIVQEFSSRWGREVAAAALGPTGRFAQRLVLFAPDWTISTTRAFVKAFGQRGMAAGAGAVLGSQVDPNEALMGGVIGGLLGMGAGKALGLKAGGGTGIKGLFRPTELADLHRQYILRSAFIYTAAVDALNYQMSGHHIWDNKDPTRLDRGDGTTQQVSKHFMEPIHWLLTPRQQALNKLSFVVKEPLTQVMDTEYLSTRGAPRMGKTPRGADIPLPTRLKHLAKSFDPISVQQSFEAGQGRGVAGFFGAPIYGKTYEEQAAEKDRRKQEAIQRRIERRAKEGR